ncbi:MAG: IPT/TIG domain-containing protein [Treponemataceae bacterium]|nr:IPT/TIG domain-containing protein [Treponemataceae bacterium]
MTRFSYILRKHPVARLAAIFALVTIGIFLLLFFSKNTARRPTLSAISPEVGKPGDILVLRGNDFGEERGSGYVEICGSRITGSGYVSWKNDEIRVLIPANIDGGFVYVVTHGGKSEPEFFTNEEAIPIFAPPNPMLNVPIISEISPANPSIGQLITITGKNFGNEKRNSAVYFSSRPQDVSVEAVRELGSDSEKNEYIPLASKFQNFLLPSDYDFDYEYWSETEIRVRVPDGTQNGSLFVVTENGVSAREPLSITRRVGEKKFTTKHTYLIQTETSISSIRGKSGGTITLHFPHPVAYSQQTQINITETVPAPALLNYRGTSIFQTTLNVDSDKPNSSEKKFSAKQTFVIERSSAETKINRDYVHAFNQKNRMLYRTYTRADEIIPANAPEILELLPNIYSNVTNPYRRAEMIFDYMTTNFRLTEKSRRQDSDSLDLTKHKRGDAYDFAVVYTALLRAAGIPARMLSGILVNADRRTQNHWWSEFYLEDFGWVPVDAALGAGMEFEPFQNERHSPKYYFGNIDAQHIAFSLAQNVIKPSALNSNIVRIPHSFAAQSVWEESPAEIKSYSSHWPVPSVLGIY